MPSGPVAAAIVLALAVLVGGVYLFMELRHHGRGHARERERDGARLPLFGTEGRMDGARESVAPSRPFPLPRAPGRTAPPGMTPAAPTPNGRNGSAAHLGFAPPPAYGDDELAASMRPTPVRPHTAIGEVPGAQPVTSSFAPPPLDAPLADAMHAGETFRFAIPDEGTLQFLPGRLEVVSGPDRGREVRFVRSGPGDQEITFGRSEGPPYRHVQLMARTVSRQHASMTLADGHWSLKNLSATNPVLLNGRALEAGEVAPLLVAGDRIEMGELVFVFHER